MSKRIRVSLPAKDERPNCVTGEVADWRGRAWAKTPAERRRSAQTLVVSAGTSGCQLSIAVIQSL